MKLTTLFSAFVLAVTVGATSASATTYRIDLEGVVDSVSAPAGLVEEDDTFGFSIIFDAHAAPSLYTFPNSRQWVWANLQIQNAYIGVHTNLVPAVTAGGVIGFNDWDGSDDTLSFSSTLLSGSSLPTNPNGSLNYAYISFSFVRPDADLSGGDWGNLMKAFLNSANTSIVVSDTRFVRSDQISARITNATISAVPLPAGFPLLAGGLIAFGLIRRRR